MQTYCVIAYIYSNISTPVYSSSPVGIMAIALCGVTGLYVWYVDL